MGPRVRLELGEDVPHVALHGLLADEESLCGVCVRHPVREQLQDLALARGLESGAKGYILKEAPHETLVRAIEKVAGGDSFIDPALMPAFLSGKDREEMLTAREREILQLLADGMSNADVAQRLFISQETVKSHVRHILAKLEADTRTHAVAIALRDAIID